MNVNTRLTSGYLLDIAIGEMSELVLGGLISFSGFFLDFLFEIYSSHAIPLLTHLLHGLSRYELNTEKGTFYLRYMIDVIFDNQHTL